jgi:glycine cleavage system regulatory protein
MVMHISLIVTVIGPDRPGLVDALAGVVEEHGGNWLESRLVRLGGQFAGVLRIQVAPEREAALTQSLQAFDRKGLKTVVHSEPQTAAEAGRETAVLEIVGQDRPGIVHQISHVLALHGINVEELATECRSAAMSGEMLFQAKARLNIPAGCDPAVLRRELEKIAEDLIVDVTLKELTAATTAPS